VAEKGKAKEQMVRAQSSIRVDPLRVPQRHAEITVNTERELLAMARPLAKRIAADPAFSAMLLSNPVLALQRYGIKLTPRLRSHVLRALRFSPSLAVRRDALAASLREALGEAPRPGDAAWLATLVFQRRGVAPRRTMGLTPVYRDEDPGGMLARLRAGRPQPTSRYPGRRHITVATRLGAAPAAPSVRRLDLEAPLPRLEPAKKAPAALSLEEAWFYKDDPVVRDAIELGQIERRAFPFRTPAEFRAIQRGEKVDAFRAFVRAVRVKPAPRP